MRHLLLRHSPGARSEPMRTIDNRPSTRFLRDDELDRASGGFHDVEAAASRWLNPLVIHGFNPQPDPPGHPTPRGPGS
jgi:hypothetical protein